MENTASADSVDSIGIELVDLPEGFGGGLMIKRLKHAQPNYVPGVAQTIGSKKIPKGTPNSWCKLLVLSYNRVDLKRFRIELDKLPEGEQEKCSKFIMKQKGMKRHIDLSPEELVTLESRREENEIARRVKEAQDKQIADSLKAAELKKDIEKEKRIEVAVAAKLKGSQNGSIPANAKSVENDCSRSHKSARK